ncbi:unnamed protein product [Linum tenue]|uniref:Uncharacterized protein n=1 Tax=Linum tenue TaxID=586396 RepID=A0AAV0IZV0_9ROSI|nr:unnamed protein product [Linum tenue]
MGRAPCCDKANVKKGPWSAEEDAKLKDYIEQHGTGGNWIALPQKIGMKRCGKSCRLRWLNYLRPNLKHGGFSEEEDNIICSLYISIGSRWSIIAAQLPGRTDNDIKNYWNTRLKKKLLGRRKQQQQGSPATSVEHDHQNHHQSPSSHGLSNSALERLQLHMKLQTLNQNPLLHTMLWPKLHPFQEKLLLQAMNDENNNNQSMQLPLLPQPEMMESPPSNTIIAKPTTTNEINVDPSPFQLGGGDDFIMGNLDNSGSSLVWWSNEFETSNGVNYDRSGSFSSSSNDSSWEYCAVRSSDGAGLF